MEFEAPSIKTLAELREKLKPLNIPIYFNLPDPDVLEPFLVIGRNNRMASTVLKDDTIGREVYHIVINVTEIIF